MKKLTQVMACAAAVATTGMSSVALAESPLTGNVGMASNYIWRGATQSNDEAAVSGGIDYAHSSGLYAGTWVSSMSSSTNSDHDAGSNTTSTQYEHDLYIGYGGEAGPVSYDVSYIKYMYPVGEKVYLDFEEINISVGYGPVTLLVAPTIGVESDPAATGTKYEDHMYTSISAEFEVKKDLMLGLVYGVYDYDEAPNTPSTASADYTHYQISLSKGDFVFAYDVMDPEATDKTGVKDAPRFSVSWSQSFDL
ncbi:MAG: TorF family putative porin [Gammaproteobacteria bacterium]|nr:TorF family putative porin [Gammaproteobacteria bacterium]